MATIMTSAITMTFQLTSTILMGLINLISATFAVMATIMKFAVTMTFQLTSTILMGLINLISATFAVMATIMKFAVTMTFQLTSTILMGLIHLIIAIFVAIFTIIICRNFNFSISTQLTVALAASMTTIMNFAVPATFQWTSTIFVSLTHLISTVSTVMATIMKFAVTILVGLTRLAVYPFSSPLVPNALLDLTGVLHVVKLQITGVLMKDWKFFLLMCFLCCIIIVTLMLLWRHRGISASFTSGRKGKHQMTNFIIAGEHYISELVHYLRGSAVLLNIFKP